MSFIRKNMASERNKLQPGYKKQTVKENLQNKVIINKNIKF